MYGLVYGFEDAGDQEIVLEFYNDGLVCESFEDREDQLPATFRFDRRLWDGWRELTIVADAEEKRSLDHFSDFGEIPALEISAERSPRWLAPAVLGCGTRILGPVVFWLYLGWLVFRRIPAEISVTSGHTK